MLAQLCDKTTALAGGGVCVHRVKSLMYQTYCITITGKAFSKTLPSHDADLYQCSKSRLSTCGPIKSGVYTWGDKRLIN